MEDLAREAHDLHEELEGEEGYVRNEVAERVDDILGRARQALGDDRVLGALSAAGGMPSADPQGPGLDPTRSDVRADSARAELRQVEAACQGASLHDRAHVLRRSIEGTRGNLPRRVASMFDALMEWVKEELPDQERLRAVPEADPNPELTELSSLTYAEAEAALGLVECELEHVQGSA